MYFSHLSVFLISVKPLTTEITEDKTAPKFCKITVGALSIKMHRAVMSAPVPPLSPPPPPSSKRPMKSVWLSIWKTVHVWFFFVLHLTRQGPCFTQDMPGYTGSKRWVFFLTPSDAIVRVRMIVTRSHLRFLFKVTTRLSLRASFEVSFNLILKTNTVVVQIFGALKFR